MITHEMPDRRQCGQGALAVIQVRADEVQIEAEAVAVERLGAFGQ